MLTLLVLCMCATKTAAAPTLPNSLPRNDIENHLNFSTTPLSMLSVPLSELDQISSHSINLTSNRLPPDPYTIPLSPTVDGSVTFFFPSYTARTNSIAQVVLTAAVEALTSNQRAYIRNPKAYLAPHATLYLTPDPALTWGLWRLALTAMAHFNLDYPYVAFSFIINLGPFNESMGSGSLVAI